MKRRHPRCSGYVTEQSSTASCMREENKSNQTITSLMTSLTREFNSRLIFSCWCGSILRVRNRTRPTYHHFEGSMRNVRDCGSISHRLNWPTPRRASISNSSLRTVRWCWIEWRSTTCTDRTKHISVGCYLSPPRSTWEMIEPTFTSIGRQTWAFSSTLSICRRIKLVWTLVTPTSGQTFWS